MGILFKGKNKMSAYKMKELKKFFCTMLGILSILLVGLPVFYLVLGGLFMSCMICLFTDRGLITILSDYVEFFLNYPGIIKGWIIFSFIWSFLAACDWRERCKDE